MTRPRRTALNTNSAVRSVKEVRRMKRLSVFLPRNASEAQLRNAKNAQRNRLEIRSSQRCAILDITLESASSSDGGAGHNFIMVDQSCSAKLSFASTSSL